MLLRSWWRVRVGRAGESCARSACVVRVRACVCVRANVHRLGFKNGTRCHAAPPLASLHRTLILALRISLALSLSSSLYVASFVFFVCHLIDMRRSRGWEGEKSSALRAQRRNERAPSTSSSPSSSRWTRWTGRCASSLTAAGRERRKGDQRIGKRGSRGKSKAKGGGEGHPPEFTTCDAGLPWPS